MQHFCQRRRATERLLLGLAEVPFQRRKGPESFAAFARLKLAAFHTIVGPVGQIDLEHGCNNSAADW